MHHTAEKLAAARRDVPCDLVIRGARVVNVFSGEVVETGVGVFEGRIVGLGDYDGREVVEAGGAFLVPGLIEGHIHVESTMLTIPEFARLVLPCGTTAAVIDPHEIANVFGVDGILYMLRSAAYSPLDVFVMLPSCVPASPFESAGANLTADDLAALINEACVAGIGEVMNFRAVCEGDPEFLRRIDVGKGKVVDGHAPGLAGPLLNAYVLAGITSDHESTTAAEAREKLRLGMHLHIREGSTERNLLDLVPVVTQANARFCSFVTDDKHPDDFLAEGHLDHSIRLAIKAGVPAVTAVQMATINTAQHYRLPNLGAIAPRYHADFFLAETLEECRPARVYKRGVLVAENGRCVAQTGAPPPLSRATMNVKPFADNPFAVAAAGARVRVINIVPRQIVTKESIEPAPVRGGMLEADTGRDLLKIAVVERHKASGNVGVALVRGFGLQRGAIASTVAHDAHNIIAVGTNDGDLRAAVEALVHLGGGLAVVEGGVVRATLALPIAGLMSTKRFEDVAAGERAVVEAARALGCTMRNPFMTLSFLALTPVPELKITDQGLVDARAFTHVALFVE
ncbi:adenine deaminase [bacterium]|nr:adenine deaminase [bacterium]